MKVCTSEDMHPFECNGPGRCRHCDRRRVVTSLDPAVQQVTHDPATCALCDPAYDYQPNAYRVTA